MALPESLRPPPVGGAPQPPPPRSKRWIAAALLAILGIGLPTWMVLSRVQRDPSADRQRAGERFVEAILAGGEATEPGGLTGFQLAYALLSPKRRAALPFDVFFENWSRMHGERGFVVDFVRVSDRKALGSARDPISYLLFLGGEQQDHATLETVRLDVEVARFENRWYVADYRLEDVPNPRAAR